MGGLSSFISATATLDVGISIANKLGTLGATIDRLGGGLALVFNTGRSPLVGSFQPIKYAAFTHLEVGANPAITEVAVGDQPGAIAEPQPELRIGVTGVMFHDNQGLLDLAGAADLSVLTSVLIYSLGDATAQGNQLEVRQGRNLVFIDLAAFAVSVRAAGNLFVEATVGTILSAYTHGVLNTTVDNHATHCILALGALTVFEDNLVVQQGGNPRICGGTIGLGDRLVDRYIGRPIERVV